MHRSGEPVPSVVSALLPAGMEHRGRAVSAMLVSAVDPDGRRQRLVARESWPRRCRCTDRGWLGEQLWCPVREAGPARFQVACRPAWSGNTSTSSERTLRVATPAAAELPASSPHGAGKELFRLRVE